MFSFQLLKIGLLCHHTCAQHVSKDSLQEGREASKEPGQVADEIKNPSQSASFQSIMAVSLYN